jgi:hypothetical protein
LPTNGRGIGPGGMRSHFQMSLSRITQGMAARPARVYQEPSADRKDIMNLILFLGFAIHCKEEFSRLGACPELQVENVGPEDGL